MDIDNSFNDMSIKRINFDQSIDKTNGEIEDQINCEESGDPNEIELKEDVDQETEMTHINMDSFENSSEMPEMDLFVPQVIIDEEEDPVEGGDNNEMLTNEMASPPNQFTIKSIQQLTDESFAGVLSIKNVEQYVDKIFKDDGHWYVCKWITGPESFCGFSTQKSSYITQHVYRHLGERTYKCQWNGSESKFNKKQNLKMHMT